MLTMKGLRVFSRKVPYDGLPKQHVHRPDRRPLGLVGSSSDSPLEGDGFEPLVPQREGMGLFETTLIGLWPLHHRGKQLTSIPGPPCVGVSAFTTDLSS